MNSEDNLAYINARWRTLTAEFTKDEALIVHYLQEIIEAYSNANRYYHNLSHIAAMLRLSDEYTHSLQDRSVVDFAIFYHDFIYKVPGSDNEAKSAQAGAKRLEKLSVPENTIREVVLFIEATKTHELSEVTHRDDLRLFLDFDMAILAASWDEYAFYFQSIRKEYKFYPNLLYNPGRADFLKKTLAKENIFHTDQFRSKLELNARQNLTKELAILSKRLTP